MTQTKNYHLPQWEAEDRLRVGDFNGAFAGLEEKLTADKAQLEEKLTADKAQMEAKLAADKAQLEAAIAARPYVVGSYMGTGAAMTVTLGFRPGFVLICGHKAGDAMNTETNILYAFGATGGMVLSSRIQLTATGFIACARASGALYPDFSINGRWYDYIAFR